MAVVGEYADQLLRRVVGVGFAGHRHAAHGQRVARAAVEPVVGVGLDAGPVALAQDVAPLVVGVGERLAVLGDRLQRAGGIIGIAARAQRGGGSC